MTAFVLSLARVGGALLAAGAAGVLVAAVLFPPGARLRAERAGWGFAAGCGMIAAMVPLAWAAGARPGWVSFLSVAAVAGAAAWRFRIRPGGTEAFGVPPPSARGGGTFRAAATAVLAPLLALGVCLYVLRALTEPMWSNDFLAIWGLKGKTLFGAGGLPERFYRSTAFEFSHPEYPLGLPLLYAGVSFLTGRWDDHAMALVFPFFQVATLLVLFGWLRRRGAAAALALSAAAAVGLYEPLFSAFLTGMAEVPLAFGALLFGTALADALDSDAGAGRRVALASALVAATKNEGLFLAAAGAAIALASRGRGKGRAALAALAPAVLVRLLHVPWRSRLPLADFEFSSFSIARVGESFAAAIRLPGAAAWLGLALTLALVLAGSRAPAGDRLLALCVCALGAYLLAPAFAVRGPAWLVETTLRRTASVLVPLAAAGIAVRLIPIFREPTADS